MTKTIRRRRKSSRTDYKSRLALLKSEKPRLVVRKTNRYIIVQLVESEIAQDKVLTSVSSKELLSKQWPEKHKGSLKSIQAAYLTGFLLVKKLKQLPEESILDIGMHRNVHGGRIFAALKGAVDAGLKIPHNEKSFPSGERLNSHKKIKLDEIKNKL
jgi:large subunit ribosomal protein L18